MKNTLKENEKIISKVISFFISKSNDNELNKLKEKYLNIIVKTINELLLIKNSGNTPEKVKKKLLNIINKSQFQMMISTI